MLVLDQRLYRSVLIEYFSRDSRRKTWTIGNRNVSRDFQANMMGRYNSFSTYGLRGFVLRCRGPYRIRVSRENKNIAVIMERVH
jgi:hypothetical protein